MNLWNNWRAALLSGAVVLLLAGGCTAQVGLPAGEPPGDTQSAEETSGQKFGLFSWDAGVMSEEEAEALDSCIRQTNVGAVYQEIPEVNLSLEETSAFIRRMKAQSIEVYALMGASEWAYEKDGGSLLYELEQIAAYNQGHPPEERIFGAMVDVEPYLLDEWDGDGRDRLMARYLSGLQNGYAYAAKNGLEFWVCIPTFYDVTHDSLLEELVSTACDGIAVMNYNRRDEYMQMAKEVGYAREYGKGVICIYELQKPGRHQLEEINTYSEQGLEALWASSRRLEDQFGYDRLQFAYHYYNPLKELLAGEE